MFTFIIVFLLNFHGVIGGLMDLSDITKISKTIREKLCIGMVLGKCI